MDYITCSDLLFCACCEMCLQVLERSKSAMAPKVEKKSKARVEVNLELGEVFCP